MTRTMYFGPAEITPEMVHTGADIIRLFSTMTAEALAQLVYEQMEKTRVTFDAMAAQGHITIKTHR